jgi:dihydropyrimidinase
MQVDCLVKGGTVVFPERGVQPADIAIKDGVVAGVLAPGEDPPEAARVIDASGKHVFPGIIDAHVHFGFAEPITEYVTETVYAAQGGVSTVLGYFLNNEPYSEVFAEQLPEAEARCHVDFGFHFSTAKDVHLEELPLYISEFGVNSFKYFMNFKGEEGRYLGLDGTDDGFMYDLLAKSAEHEGVVVVMHTENIELVARLRRKFQLEGRDSLREYCLSKPVFTETENIVRAMVFAEETGATIFIPHVSCAAGVEEVRRYRERYDRVYIETCPHYLTHTMESDLGSIAKANPPLRSDEDVEALWAGLTDGSIDIVASDHVPRKRETKEKNIWQASQGFPGTATILPVLLSEGYHKRGLDLQRIAQLVTSRPAEIFAIDQRKGFIMPGGDADLTLVDLDLEREVRPEELGSYSDYSPYEGWTLKGWPVMTMVRGVVVMENGEIVGPQGHGQFLRRPLT